MSINIDSCADASELPGVSLLDDHEDALWLLKAGNQWSEEGSPVGVFADRDEATTRACELAHSIADASEGGGEGAAGGGCTDVEQHAFGRGVRFETEYRYVTVLRFVEGETRHCAFGNAL